MSPSSFLRDHIIDHYVGNRAEPDPQTIYEFNRGKAVLGKVRFTLPSDVLRKFSFDAKGNLRSLKTQALFLVVPLIDFLLKERNS